MGNRHYDPVYAAAEELGCPVITHPSGAEGTYLGAPYLPGGVAATYVERHVALSLIGQANLSSLILDGAFERFPRLKVVFAEWGFTWAAPLMWRLDAEWEASRAELPSVPKKPSEYFLENVRFTTQPLEEPHQGSDLIEMMRMMKAERTLLFSTDYPHWDADNPYTLRAKLPADLQERVFTANAIETFPRL
jgi:predicted TIM-barrel fold metal-dependent hydrolase